MKHRFKIVLAAGAAICALMAVSAGAAQAAPEWYVNGSTLTTTLQVTSTGGPFELSTKIGSTNVVIKCTTESNVGTIDNGTNVTGETGGTDAATITFSGCSIPVAPACVVPNISASVGTHLKEVGGKIYDIFRPATGTVFATIVVEGCALEGEFEVKGTTAGLDSEASTEKKAHTLAFSGANSTAAGTALTFGGNAATLTGSATETLMPEGSNWSAH
jgi:hypothetical protein